MSKHTPGPWAVKYHENTDTRSVYVAGRSWESWTVCEIGHSKEDEHNARLIAVAPDLLDFLFDALPYVEEGEEFNKPTHRNLSRDIRALLREIDPESGV
jgi:hypothetical protein